MFCDQHWMYKDERVSFHEHFQAIIIACKAERNTPITENQFFERLHFPYGHLAKFTNLQKLTSLNYGLNIFGSGNGDSMMDRVWVEKFLHKKDKRFADKEG